MKRYAKHFAAWFFAALLCVQSFTAGAFYTDDALHKAAAGIVEWKKETVGAGGDLLTSSFCQSAGSSAADWYAMALGRMGTESGERYLSALRDYVESRYRTENRLDAKRATEWHRIALTVLALGGDPTAFGTDADGVPIDLVADGTYNRARIAPLGAQGVNGYIWALLTLDAGHFTVPEGAVDTRASMIAAIGENQLENGGVALDGKIASVDVTAMAVTALASYYADEAYPSVRETIDRALAYLSARQNPEGDFSSFGQPNAESTAQVLIALCSLGIDPTADGRFVKEGHTVIDGMMAYRTADGGFAHVRSGNANSMASEQVLCALNAWERLHTGAQTFYDMRPRAVEPPPSSSTAAEAAAKPETSSAEATANTASTASSPAQPPTTAPSTEVATAPSLPTTTIEEAEKTETMPQSPAGFWWICVISVGAAAIVAGVVYRRHRGKERPT